MNARTATLLALWIGLTIVVGWAATLPDPYFDGMPAEHVPSGYSWEYPALLSVVGGIILVSIRPWRKDHSFWGALFAFLLSTAAYIIVSLSFMHAPPAHTWIFFILFLVSQALLFYSGYALAWRKHAVSGDEDAT